MNRRKLNLKTIRREINSLPFSLTKRRELEEVYSELKKTLKDSKRENANIDYYKPKIDRAFDILRRNV